MKEEYIKLIIEIIMILVNIEILSLNRITWFLKFNMSRKYYFDQFIYCRLLYSMRKTDYFYFEYIKISV